METSPFRPCRGSLPLQKLGEGELQLQKQQQGEPRMDADGRGWELRTATTNPQITRITQI